QRVSTVDRPLFSRPPAAEESAAPICKNEAMIPRQALRPRPRCAGLFLEARDLVFLDKRESDVIEAVEQAVLAVRIDFKSDHAAIGPAYFLLFEVDGEARIGAALGIVEQLLQILRADLDRQKAILEAIIVENVAERGRYHAGDAEVLERPR